ncbi:MAG: hypothetical protein RLZ68_510, partial [Pseudomonadota bacterium]
MKINLKTFLLAATLLATLIPNAYAGLEFSGVKVEDTATVAG